MASAVPRVRSELLLAKASLASRYTSSEAWRSPVSRAFPTLPEPTAALAEREQKLPALIFPGDYPAWGTSHVMAEDTEKGKAPDDAMLLHLTFKVVYDYLAPELSSANAKPHDEPVLSPLARAPYGDRICAVYVFFAMTRALR